MAKSYGPVDRPKLTFGLSDLLWVVTASAIGCSITVQSNWIVGVLAFDAMIILCRTRHRQFAAVPGLALGVVLAWATLPVYVNTLQVLILTAFGAATGAAFNAIAFRYYFTGIFGLVGVAIVVVIGQIVGSW